MRELNDTEKFPLHALYVHFVNPQEIKIELSLPHQKMKILFKDKVLTNCFIHSELTIRVFIHSELTIRVFRPTSQSILLLIGLVM